MVLARPSLCTALMVAVAVAVPHDHSDHSHVARGLGLGAWYQERSEVHDLFRRAPGDQAAVGSPEWLAQYPPAGGIPSQAEKDIPAAWLSAYRAVKAAGKIPNIPVSQILTNPQPGERNPSYGNLDSTGPEICSGTFKCRAKDDIWDAPDGTIGISFDDGPWRGTNTLLDFLQTTNQTATHFCIGRNIAQFPDQFTRAFKQGGEMAVHTWSHPLMTAQSDLGVLVELGWTMQIIYDLTGGRVPKYWRPPQGDADNRVRAIAKEVFGMTTVFWNQDTEDWSLSDPTPIYTGQQIQDLLAKWLSGPKSPGLIILEHELTDDTVGIFANTTWPNIKSQNWQAKGIAQLFNLPVYQNAKDNTSPVTPTKEVALPLTFTGSWTSTETQSTPTPGSNSNGAGSDGNGSGNSGSGGDSDNSGSDGSGSASRATTSLLAAFLSVLLFLNL